MQTFTIDVWHCGENDRPIHRADWRRYVVSARDAVDAELIACRMAYRHGHAVESVVIDWYPTAQVGLHLASVVILGPLTAKRS